MATIPTQSFDIKELQELIGIFKRTMSDLYKKETSVLHCSLSHLEVMQFIGEHTNPSMKDIASYLRITPPSVTTIIETMVEQGLVKRDTGSGDRRTIHVVLTPKAVKLSTTLRAKKKAMLTLMLKKLSAEQKQQLSDIIKALVK
ncbi:MAG: MarR family transcriptional regulator [Candidatus Paceibacterota bacterium]